MIKHLMERLVLEVVRSVIGDEAENLSSDSDFDVLDVDQLGMTYIVVALESRLGIELPTHLEDARTVADLVTGAQDELRNKLRLSQCDRPLPILNEQAALSRPATSKPSERRTLGANASRADVCLCSNTPSVWL